LEILEIVGFSQLLKEDRGLVLDVLRKAERIAALRYPNRPRLSRPIVYVLKEMMVDGTVVSEIQRPAGSGSSARALEISASKASSWA
jgi:hypothetical protein